MSKFLLSLLMISFTLAGTLSADVYVKPHWRDGTHVQEHYRSDPNSSKSDNWSTRGNINPRTGEPGTK